MILKLKLVKVDSKYCDYLRKFDSKVAYNKNRKDLRPFVGVLFKIDKYEYFAPLTSPKPKHLKMQNTLDFFKIKNGEFGAVNFNNMIPVISNNYEVIYFKDDKKSISDRKYEELLKNQVNWLNENYIQVKNKSRKLYDLFNCGKLSSNIMDRCCNFKLLEKKCEEYNNLIVKS